MMLCFLTSTTMHFSSLCQITIARPTQMFGEMLAASGARARRWAASVLPDKTADTAVHLYAFFFLKKKKQRDGDAD